MRKFIFFMTGVAVFLTTTIGCQKNEFWTIRVINRTQHYLHVIPRTDDDAVLFLKPGETAIVFSGTNTGVSIIAFYAPGQNVEGLAEETFTNPQELEVIISCNEEKTVAAPQDSDVVWEVKAEDLQ